MAHLNIPKDSSYGSLSSPLRTVPNSPNTQNENMNDSSTPLLMNATDNIQTQPPPFDTATNTTVDQQRDDFSPSPVDTELSKASYEKYENNTSLKLAAFFATGPIFSAYASLIVLQERVRHLMGIKGSSPEASSFQYAVSCLFYAILVIRLAHNVIFAGLRPRNRVLVCYGLIIISLVIIVLFVCLLQIHSIPLVGFSYLIGGLGIGGCEVNIVSTISPLGGKVKLFCITSMPICFRVCAMAAFFFFASNPGNESFTWITFLLVAIFCVTGALVYGWCVPDVNFSAAKARPFSEFIKDFSSFREWSNVAPNVITFFFDMFVVTLASGASNYVYDKAELQFFGTTVEKNVFLALFNTAGFLGDLVSRIICYNIKNVNLFGRFSPLELCLLVVLGGVGVMSTRSDIACFAFFVVMFANGFCYASTTRRIDQEVPGKYNNTALSISLFAGDAGSSIGSTLTHALSRAVGKAA